MQYAETVRSPQQIAQDLGEALAFSAVELRSCRQGMLPASAGSRLLARVIKPLVVSASVTLLPLLGGAYVVSQSHNCSWSDGLVILFSTVVNFKDFAESQGWFRAVLYVVGALACLGLGAYQASRIPIALVADMLAKQVCWVEGRITAREEEKPQRGKRDEVVHYYFEMKDHLFEVSRRAFLAVDSGALYRVYFLPRSHHLLAVEPSVLAKEAGAPGSTPARG